MRIYRLKKKNEIKKNVREATDKLLNIPMRTAILSRQKTKAKASCASITIAFSSYKFQCTDRLRDSFAGHLTIYRSWREKDGLKKKKSNENIQTHSNLPRMSKRGTLLEETMTVPSIDSNRSSMHT